MINVSVTFGVYSFIVNISVFSVGNPGLLITDDIINFPVTDNVNHLFGVCM